MSINFCAFNKKISNVSTCQAINTWVRLVNFGRQKIDQEHWQEAATLYLLAHTICNKLSESDAKKPYYLDFYLRTQMELIFVLRKSEYPLEIKILEGNVLSYLEKLESRKLLDKPIAELIKPVTDVARSPINLVNSWITKYLAINQARYATRH